VEEQIETDHKLPSSQAFHLYRVLQEAINNALKHSNGKNIMVTITGNTGWKASVRDDGSGMDNNKLSPLGGNGLQNMRARCKEAGWDISWHTGEAGGTSVGIVPTTN